MPGPPPVITGIFSAPSNCPLGGAVISGSAFAGALLATLMVFGLAHGTGSWTPSRLLLTGVVVAAGWGAVITLMLAISPARELPGMLYWLMGDVS